MPDQSWNTLIDVEKEEFSAHLDLIKRFQHLTLPNDKELTRS
nr:hypothetical protein [Mucilaginibacter sp. SP1R1]